ncbi:MAG: response regulator [Chloroflexota bacterium]
MKPVTLLLVDDNPRFLSAASGFLGEVDDFVLLSTLEGGAEAVAKAKELQPDIILVDLAMPDIAGLQLIPMLRESIPNIGIVALTVHDNPQYQEAALAAGADAFITKSSILRTLESTIKEVRDLRSGLPDLPSAINPPVPVTRKSSWRPTAGPSETVNTASAPPDKLSAPMGLWPSTESQATQAAPAELGSAPAAVKAQMQTPAAAEYSNGSTASAMGGDAVDDASAESSEQSNSVLVLDDDPGIRNIYKKALNHKGYQIDLASNLAEAREFLNEKVYGVFICDIHVGKERGTDLLAEVGNGLKAKGTQIIMASAYGQYRYIAEDYGSEYFLEKPVSIHTLVTLIEQVLADGQSNLKPQKVATGTPAT